MKRRSRQRPIFRDKKRRGRGSVVAVSLAGAAFLVAGAALFSRVVKDEQGPAAAPGPVHVHALGVNPGDSALFIATHTGLFRLDSDADQAVRVGDRYQDTMGFTVAGPDHFLGSGHPDFRDNLPPLLGLVESRDGGKTWTPRSLLGKADFHSLRARGRLFVGYDATGGRVMVSRDAGRTWRSSRTPQPFLDLVVEPGANERLLAAGESHLFSSSDGGRSWDQRDQGTGLLAWPRRDRLYLLDGGGRVWLSVDAGERWQPRGQIGGRPAAFYAETTSSLYAATHEGVIKHSSDGGMTWTTLTKP